MTYSNKRELYHWGVKGQKWGIRRFQNEDGSLTSEGAARYGTKGNANDNKTKIDALKIKGRNEQKITKIQGQNDLKIARENNQLKREKAAKAFILGLATIGVARLAIKKYTKTAQMKINAESNHKMSLIKGEWDKQQKVFAEHLIDRGIDPFKKGRLRY